MIAAAVLAGGTGSRMGADMPKQFLPLGKSCVVLRVLDAFLACPRVDAVYLGVHPDWLAHARSLLDGRKVTLVPGGAQRNETLMRVAAAVERDSGGDDPLLLTHDAARPFVSARIIEDNIAAGLAFGLCATALRSTDSVMRSADGQTIDAMPDRDTIFRAQTPQTFRLSLLKSLDARLRDDERARLTDAVGMAVLRGERVRIVPGDALNFKITTPEDYRLACALAAQLDEA